MERENVSKVLERSGYRIYHDGNFVRFRYCEEQKDGIRQWKMITVSDRPTILFNESGSMIEQGETNGSTIGMVWHLTRDAIVYGNSNVIKETVKRCVTNVLVRMLADGYTATDTIKWNKKEQGENSIISVGVKAEKIKYLL